MKRHDARVLAEQVAWGFLGRPYIWGGDDPMKGFDCSGYAQEPLKSVGLLTRGGDWTAHMLLDLFVDSFIPPEINPKLGCLAFWHSSTDITRIVHVEFCLNDGIAIGASGGGSSTKTIRDAIQQNAYIKVRPIRSRAHLHGFVDPFLKLDV